VYVVNIQRKLGEMSNTFFPSRRLTLYMGKAFVVRTFAILFILTLVLQVLDLLSETGHVLAYPGNGNPELQHYVMLRYPQLLSTFLPYSVLLGTLATFFTLNQNSEVISMKAAGLSAHQILAPAVLAASFIALISFGFNERVVSRATDELSRWEAVGFGQLPKIRNGLDDVWVKEGANLIHADSVANHGVNTQLTGVTVYVRTANGLSSIIRAPNAYPKGGGWELRAARRFDVATGIETPIGTIVSAYGVRPDQFTLATIDADRLPIDALGKAIVDLRAAGRPTDALEAGWWHKISGPLSSLLMPLLGSVAAFGLARSGRLFIRAVIGMALGFTYFVADTSGLTMGNIGVYPPLLAAWGPFLLFLLIGETVLLRTEE
jgi:lipopolysaccharide export system permease protein